MQIDGDNNSDTVRTETTHRGMTILEANALIDRKTMKAQTREEIIKGLYKPIAQPHVETFQDCFDDWSEWTDKPQFAPREITGQSMTSDNGRMQVGPYCIRRDGKSLAVRCADWVLSRIREKTIIVDNDRMHFEIVDHENGYSLVIASHGQIIGSVWLAYIKTETIPNV